MAKVVMTPPPRTRRAPPSPPAPPTSGELLAAAFPREAFQTGHWALAMEIANQIGALLGRQERACDDDVRCVRMAKVIYRELLLWQACVDDRGRQTPAIYELQAERETDPLDEDTPISWWPEDVREVRYRGR
jgi:hypothetical protein